MGAISLQLDTIVSFLHVWRITGIDLSNLELVHPRYRLQCRMGDANHCFLVHWKTHDAAIGVVCKKRIEKDSEKNLNISSRVAKDKELGWLGKVLSFSLSDGDTQTDKQTQTNKENG